MYEVAIECPFFPGEGHRLLLHIKSQDGAEFAVKSGFVAFGSFLFEHRKSLRTDFWSKMVPGSDVHYHLGSTEINQSDLAYLRRYRVR
jgi:hypothetical protein